MPRPKKHRSLDTANMDPMTAAIMAGLKPHIDAAVRDQIATVLLEVLAKVAPDRLAKAVTKAAPEAPPALPVVPARGDVSKGR